MSLTTPLLYAVDKSVTIGQLGTRGGGRWGLCLDRGMRVWPGWEVREGFPEEGVREPHSRVEEEVCGETRGTRLGETPPSQALLRGPPWHGPWPVTRRRPGSERAGVGGHCAPAVFRHLPFLPGPEQGAASRKPTWVSAIPAAEDEGGGLTRRRLTSSVPGS